MVNGHATGIELAMMVHTHPRTTAIDQALLMTDAAHEVHAVSVVVDVPITIDIDRVHLFGTRNVLQLMKVEVAATIDEMIPGEAGAHAHLETMEAHGTAIVIADPSPRNQAAQLKQPRPYLKNPTNPRIL